MPLHRRLPTELTVPPAEPAPATPDEIEAALHALDGEVAAASAWIAAFDERERAMLDRQAGDPELAEHDAEKVQRRRDIARLAARRRQLEARAAELRAVALAEEFEAFRERYSAAVLRLAAALDGTWSLHREVAELAASIGAGVLGFDVGMSPPPPVLTAETAAALRARVASLASRQAPTPIKPPPTVAVVFVARWRHYMVGDRAGFSPADASGLIAVGTAVLDSRVAQTIGP